MAPDAPRRDDEKSLDEKAPFDEDALDRGLAEGFGSRAGRDDDARRARDADRPADDPASPRRARDDEPPLSAPTAHGGRPIRRRSLTGAPEHSVLQLIEDRTGRNTRVHLRDEESRHGASPVVAGRRGPAAEVPMGRGNYQVLGEIARGGMGLVLRGHDTDLGRDVAMKVLLEEHADSESILQRFVEEAQIGGQLQHPGIVPVYELGLLDDDRPYFTMKLVKGRTLAALLSERSGPTDDRRRFLGIFEQVCQTMAYAHARRVIHRDLKPANIMVGAFGEVQVVDWGLAKVLREGGVEDERRAARVDTQVSLIETVRSGSTTGDGSQSLVGSVMGTPSYMSPEQAQGEVDRLDERTDVFALGAILCEILTGRPPYTGEHERPVTEAARAMLDDAKERLAACEADPALVEVALHCLSPARTNRPAHAGALAQLVQNFLAGREEAARKAQLEAAEAAVRVVQERKRRKLTLALAATVLAATLGGGWAYGAVKDEQAQRAAAESEAVAAQLRRQDEVRAKVMGVAEGAHRALGEGDYAAALVALDQADVVLAASSEAPPDLGDRVATLRAEVLDARRAAEQEAVEQGRLDALLTELDRIQSARHDGSGDEIADRRNGEYEAAFRAYGIEPLAADAADVERAILDTGHAQVLARSLDEWARLRLYTEGFDSAAFRHLIELALAVDPDPWRQRIRRAVLADDRLALEEIVATADPTTWPPETTLMFVQTVELLGHNLDVIPMLEAACGRHPDHALLLAELGMTYGARGDHERGLHRLVAAHAIKPAAGNIFVPMLRMMLELERYDDMIRRCIAFQARYADEDWISSWMLARLADVLLARGRYDIAIRIMDETLAVSPIPTLQLNNLAWFLATAPEPYRDAERAVEVAERCLDLAPDDGNTWNTYGTSLYRAGRLRDALEAFKTSMELEDGGNPFDWAYVAMILERLGAPDEAERWLAQAEQGADWELVNIQDNPFRRREEAPPQDFPPVLAEAQVLVRGG